MKARGTKPVFLIQSIVIAGVFLLGPIGANAGGDSCKRKQLLAEIRSSELSFAAAAQEMPTRDAFLKFLAPDSILFRPGPVDGRTHMEGVTPGSGTLEWKPRQVDISADGDLGFTYGPWVSRDAEGVAAGTGEFISIWKRQPDGSLKVVLDTGTVWQEPGDENTVEKITNWKLDSSVASTPEVTPEQLMHWDSAGGGAINRKGSAARIFRHGSPSYLQSPETVAPAGELSWRPAGSGLSQSKDLGYSFGTLHTSENELTESYLHIWRCCVDTDWVLLVDVHVEQ